MGQIDNLSVGGALAACRESFEMNTELAMLFQLPPNFRIHAFGRVIYAIAARHFGIAFIDLDAEARLHLEEFTRKELGYRRRSGRVPHRTHLIIQCEAGGPHDGEPADTVLVSRNGGLLVCRATYSEGQEIYLWSPERKSGARARVAFQQVWGPSGLTELGFEFVTDTNFWGVDFIDDCE